MDPVVKESLLENDLGWLKRGLRGALKGCSFMTLKQKLNPCRKSDRNVVYSKLQNGKQFLENSNEQVIG